MGICAACFIRDTSGALGFQSALAYIRPEIIGIVLGAFIAALFFGKFEPRGGSAPTTRFFFGVFAMLGALVFLGCPWRALLRFRAGDLSAIAGIVGLGGGCPGRQLIKSAEGDSDSGVFVMGLIAGAGIAHNFGVAASPNGLGANSAAAVIIGLIFCVLAAIFSRRTKAMQG